MKRLKRREADKRLYMREKPKVRKEQSTQTSTSTSILCTCTLFTERREHYSLLVETVEERPSNESVVEDTYIYSSICSNACVCMYVCACLCKQMREESRVECLDDAVRVVGVRVARARRTGRVERERKGAAARATATALEWSGT